MSLDSLIGIRDGMSWYNSGRAYRKVCSRSAPSFWISFIHSSSTGEGKRSTTNLTNQTASSSLAPRYRRDVSADQNLQGLHQFQLLILRSWIVAARTLTFWFLSGTMPIVLATRSLRMGMPGAFMVLSKYLWRATLQDICNSCPWWHHSAILLSFQIGALS